MHRQNLCSPLRCCRFFIFLFQKIVIFLHTTIYDFVNISMYCCNCFFREKRESIFFIWTLHFLFNVERIVCFKYIHQLIITSTPLLQCAAAVFVCLWIYHYSRFEVPCRDGKCLHILHFSALNILQLRASTPYGNC